MRKLAIACVALAFARLPLAADPAVEVRLPQPKTAITIDVADYFQQPDGARRSVYQAFKAALEDARERQAARVVFPPGRHVFSDPGIPGAQSHLLLVNQSDLEIDGRGAELVFTVPEAQGLVLAACERILIKNLSIDWDVHLASGGVVEQQPDGTKAVRIYDEFPVSATTPIEAVSEFDVAARRWKAGPVEVYYPRDVRMVAPRTFSSPAFRSFADGTEVLVRHKVYGANAIGGYMMQLHDVTIEDVTVYSSPGMAFYFIATGKGIRLSRCIVKPKEGRLISTSADGAHFATTAGHIIVEDCDFSGQGDDSVSINAHWLRILEQPDPLTVRLGVVFQSRYFPGWITPGTELTIRDAATLAETTRRRVVSVTDEPASRSFRVQLDSPLDIGPSHRDAVVGTDMMASANFIVRNNRFHDHRGRGMLLMTRTGLVENNVVSHPTMSCVNITADASYFWVGFGAHDLVVRNNRFEGCNYAGEKLPGGGQLLAAVNVFAEVASGIGPVAVHENITLERNTITDTPGRALLIASAAGVRIAHNAIIDANTRPSMMSPDDPACSLFITSASDVVVVGLSEQTTRPTYGAGVAVDPKTTSNVTLVRSRQRPSRVR